MFIEQHDFIGRAGVEITERVKILLASIAISISFGYREYLFSKLDRVIVYPKDYFSLINQEQHKGETNPRYKTLVLSWKHFEEGIKMEHDNLNLGIHEFTHALHFSFLSSSGRSARYFKKHYRAILKYLEDPKERKKLIDSNYLRAYAFENQYEFLAVLVEHFFETEAEFKRKLPTLHLKVEKLLRYSSLRNS